MLSKQTYNKENLLRALSTASFGGVVSCVRWERDNNLALEHRFRYNQEPLQKSPRVVRDNSILPHIPHPNRSHPRKERTDWWRSNVPSEDEDDPLKLHNSSHVLEYQYQCIQERVKSPVLAFCSRAKHQHSRSLDRSRPRTFHRGNHWYTGQHRKVQWDHRPQEQIQPKVV